MRIVERLQAFDGPEVNPLCRTRLYSQGHRVERALVLLHGFTNCPQQFDAIGRQFYERGWNVLIPRYPHHGFANRLNTTISTLRADDLINLADESAGAAHGLGERVTVAGLSLGGSLAGHLAQNHDFVARAVLIAPMFGVKWIPKAAQRFIGRAAVAAPNFYVWWNPKLKEHLPPTYGYPRFSTHAYAALFDIAARVTEAARRAKPKAAGIAIITNANDPGLDNRFTEDVAELWRARGADVTAFEFPASDHLPHDLIDPLNPEQNTALVYPVITRLISG